MGQRLVINVKKNDIIITSIYYHWSAYTRNAFYIVNDLVDTLTDIENITRDPKLVCLEFVEKDGGGVNGGAGSIEMVYAQKLFPDHNFELHPDRNDGLVAFSPKCIYGMRGWAEHEVEIDLDRDKVLFNVWWCWEDLETFKEEHEITDENINVVSTSLDVENIYFNEFASYDLFLTALKTYDNSKYTVIKSNDAYYIEIY